MFSFLKEIDKYIKDKKIPFKRIEFSSAYLPDYLNQAILNEMRKVTTHFELGIPTYELVYDNNGNLCLVVEDIHHRNTTVFTNSENNVSFDFKFITRSEEKLIKSACILKYFENYRLKIRKIIERDYSHLPAIEKVKCEYYTMLDVIKKKRRYKKELYKNITNEVDYEVSLTESIEKITSYLDYLYLTYKLDTNAEEESKKIYGISYREPEKELYFRKEPFRTYGPSKERVNEIITADERFAVLESYPYIYRDYAYNKFNKEISYMAYIYKISSDNYILIMEPYKGTKYTKIASIKEAELTRESFEKYIKHYLEQTNSSCISDNSVIRMGHTTIDMYKKKIGYAIIGISDDLYGDYYKEKIKKLRER